MGKRPGEREMGLASFFTSAHAFCVANMFLITEEGEGEGWKGIKMPQENSDTRPSDFKSLIFSTPH